VDTAGRLGVDADLMQQASDIRDAVQPDEVLFVLDAMIGQSAVDTAKQFDEGVSLTGVVMTKLDGDARGGAALSVVTVTGSPILFASTGEKLTDFEVFHPDRMAGRILDMGDVLTLIEQAEKAFDAEQTAKMAGKLQRGDDFTLTDFLEQMQAVRRMGPLKNMLKMLPGMGDMKEQLDAFDERELDRVEAIVRSMTPAERDDLKLLNGSRRSRIAKGSGTQVSDVNGLVERFGQAQKMMKQMRNGGGMPGMPGCPAACPGCRHGGRRSRQAGQEGQAAAAAQGVPLGQPRQARRRAGRPARRPAAAGSGSAFGLGAAPRTTSWTPAPCPRASATPSAGAEPGPPCLTSCTCRARSASTPTRSGTRPGCWGGG
jgi:signal recognition particle subunit SRP54